MSQSMARHGMLTKTKKLSRFFACD